MSAINFLTLSLIKGIGNRTALKLLEIFKTPEALFDASYSTLEKIAGKKISEKILNYSDARKKAEEIISICESKGIKIVSINDKEYPENLKQIPDPPIILYIKGNDYFPKKSISIVGSRKYSLYGKSVTERFSKYLAEEGICIVSGLASGIDSIAHRTSVNSNGYTIAVLGTGVDIIYPYLNKRLYQEIIEKGCVISEFPPGTKPNRFNFPLRNRIIAGLSYGTIVTEASGHSGALITAKLANEYGRVVFTVPANINNPYSEGNNLLLKEGAIPLLKPEEIREHLPFLFSSGQSDRKDISLSSEEKKVLEILIEPSHIDKIIEETGLPIETVSLILFNLEIKELVENRDGFYYKK